MNLSSLYMEVALVRASSLHAVAAAVALFSSRSHYEHSLLEMPATVSDPSTALEHHTVHPAQQHCVVYQQTLKTATAGSWQQAASTAC